MSTAMTSAALRAYKQSYQKRGQQDPHELVFESVAERIQPKNVLYPGCHRHLTASLYFSSVDYVDSYEKVEAVFQDEGTRNWVIENHKCKEEPAWTFSCANYESLPPTKFQTRTYDLMISLSAGIVSTHCVKYLRDGGYVLVNDSHADAIACRVNPELKLDAVYEDGEWSTEPICEYFKTKQGHVVTEAQAEEASRIGAKSKRSFRMQRDAPFYLFRRQPQSQRKRKLGKET